MKNVKLKKANPKGWFLKIGDEAIYNQWVVTSEELWCVWRIIHDHMSEIFKELENEPKSK